MYWAILHPNSKPRMTPLSTQHKQSSSPAPSVFHRQCVSEWSTLSGGTSVLDWHWIGLLASAFCREALAQWSKKKWTISERSVNVWHLITGVDRDSVSFYQLLPPTALQHSFAKLTAIIKSNFYSTAYKTEKPITSTNDNWFTVTWFWFIELNVFRIVHLKVSLGTQCDSWSYITFYNMCGKQKWLMADTLSWVQNPSWA